MSYSKIVFVLALFSFLSCVKQKDKETDQNTTPQVTVKLENKEKYSRKAIKKAIESNDPEFVHFIDSTKNINKFYEFDESNSYTILGYCCKYNRYDFVQKIIAAKADIAQGEQDEFYILDALYVAIENQNEKIVKLLLDHNAKVNSVYTESGVGPLSLACGFSNFEIIKMLIDHNADVKGHYNRESEMASFPVLEATMSNNIRAVKLLVEKGADVNQTDLGDLSALSYAKEHNQEIYDYLLSTVK